MRMGILGATFGNGDEKMETRWKEPRFLHCCWRRASLWPRVVVLDFMWARSAFLLCLSHYMWKSLFVAAPSVVSSPSLLPFFPLAVRAGVRVVLALSLSSRHVREAAGDLIPESCCPSLLESSHFMFEGALRGPVHDTLLSWAFGFCLWFPR